MSKLWIFAPLLGWIITFIINMLPFLIGVSLFGGGSPSTNESTLVFVIALIVGLIISIYPWYLMIKRRTDHFNRERTLKAGIIELIQEKSHMTRVAVPTELATLNAVYMEANSEETDKNPIVWTLIAMVIPWIGMMFVLYFLMKDIYKHHNRDLAFMQHSGAALNRMGYTIVVPSWRVLPPRSFMLYFILSCCIPCFGLYWAYSIINDYNEHFTTQWQFEDQLVIAYQ